eukprot:scaffold110254_cov14-Tisochrysis_lutea.AAC.1
MILYKPRKLQTSERHNGGLCRKMFQQEFFFGPEDANQQFLVRQHDTKPIPLQIGRLLTNICSGTPDGVVTFMPSFAYLEQLMQRWTATGALTAMMTRQRCTGAQKRFSEGATATAPFIAKD